MQAWICTAYGPPEVLALREVEKPNPQAGEILVRIVATTVNSGDVRVRAARVPKGMRLLVRLALGWSRPRQPVLGTELSGIVEAAGETVTKFRPGDEVFAFPGVKMGCHAEYRILKENERVFLKPKTLSFAEAASLSFGGSTALHFMRKANLARGEKLLVIGASGAVGSAIVQIAKHIGAEVTCVTSGPNGDLVRSLGASRVIDYRNEDFKSERESYHVIAECTGVHTFSDCRHVLKPGGRFLGIAAGLPDMVAMLWSKAVYGKRIVAGPAEESSPLVQQIGEWAEAGIFKPVIDRSFPFQAMREAHDYVDRGRKRGSVVIEVTPRS